MRALTNESGTVTDTVTFDAFGNKTEHTGTTDNYYGFQGEEQDATGFYYLRARYMDPATGTFTSMDTYGGSLTDPMSLHKYLFANSNPVMYSDPSGCFSMSEQMLVCGLIGELVSSTLYYVELFTTDNIQYDKSEKYIWGGLMAAIEGIIMGVAFCLLYLVFAFLTTAYIATVIFCATGFFMSVFGMLEGVDDIENGDSYLGWTKIIINAITAVICVFSLINGIVAENVANNNESVNYNDIQNDYENEIELFRRESNVGEFRDLQETMQLRNVKRVASKAGIGLDGIRIKIVRDPTLIGKGVYGYTDGKTITLYPDAFTNTEMLVKTLGHERIHIYQTSVWGRPQTSEMLYSYEQAAIESESSWWLYYQNGGN